MHNGMPKPPLPLDQSFSPMQSPRKTPPPSMTSFVPSLEKLDVIVNQPQTSSTTNGASTNMVEELQNVVRRPLLLSTLFAHELFNSIRGMQRANNRAAAGQNAPVSAPATPVSGGSKGLPLWKAKSDQSEGSGGRHSPSMYSLPSALSMVAKSKKQTSMRLGTSQTAQHDTFDDIKEVVSDVDDHEADDRTMESSMNHVVPPVQPPSPLASSYATNGQNGAEEATAPADTTTFPTVGFFSSRRVITDPAFPLICHVHSIDGTERCVDNANADLVLYVGMQLLSRYEVVRMLGSGTFGQVALCRDIYTQRLVAVKVIKSNQAFEFQSGLEVALVQQLSQFKDPRTRYFPSILLSGASHGHHVFAMELLGMNLFELLEMNNYKGLSVRSIREIAYQSLEALSLLFEKRIIHCDLKPENMLLSTSRNEDDDVEHRISSSTVTLIDFGSSCYDGQQMYTYIQSRYYRAPEVVIGAPYSTPIDMWSCACVLAELYLGLPLLPGQSDYRQLVRMEEMFGPLPATLLEQGTVTSTYYSTVAPTSGSMGSMDTSPISNGDMMATPTDLHATQEFTEAMMPRYAFALKPEEQYLKESGVEELPPFRRYFNYRKLPELIQHCPLTVQEKKWATVSTGGENQNKFDENVVKEIIGMRRDFCDLLMKMLRLDPGERITPHDALKHSFFQSL